MREEGLVQRVCCTLFVGVGFGAGIGFGAGSAGFGGSAGLGGSAGFTATGCGFGAAFCPAGTIGFAVVTFATAVVALALGVGAVVVSLGDGEGLGTGAAMLAEGGALFAVVGSCFGPDRVARIPPATAAITRTAAPIPMSAYGGLFVGTTGSACHALFVDAPGKPG